MRKPVKKALFSVDNPLGVSGFAKSLNSMGWHVIASKETVERLRALDLPVEDVSSFTGISEEYGFPPTLHPKIEAALTIDITDRIDLVYDVPYPMRKGNDVGGRTLLALGAKGGRIVVHTPSDMKQVIAELRKDKAHASIPDDFRRNLIDKANAFIAKHYLSLARRGGESRFDGFVGEEALRLVHGENPYQAPSSLFARNDGDALSTHNFRSVGRGVPCFTNLADLDSVLHTLCLASEAFRLKYGKVPFIAVAAKHGNACGMSVDWKSEDNAVDGALWGNPLAVWGGEFIANFEISADLGRLLLGSPDRGDKYGSINWMLDVIAAPGFDKKAVEVLGRRAMRKLFKNPALSGPGLPDDGWHFRQVRGGFLRQPLPDVVLDLRNKKLGSRIMDSLIIAWSSAYSSFHGGNEVALAKDGKLIGVGGGPSTVEAAETAVNRALARGHDARGSVFAADAFFPFTDAPKVLADAGCRAGVVPAGGKNERKVKEFFHENEVDVVYLPPGYRGFCRH